MPYEFRYTLNKPLPGGRQPINKTFRCYLKRLRCEHESNDRQCNRVVYIGLPYCWQHLRQKHLIIRKTENKGLGLFAYWPQREGEIVFRKGDIICSYYGDMLTREEISDNYYALDEKGKGIGLAPYGYQPGVTPPVGNHSVHTTVDSACLRTIGSIINTPSRGESTNAKFGGYKRGSNRLNIICTENIREGREILIGYGPKYATNSNYVTHRTKSVTAKYVNQNPPTR